MRSKVFFLPLSYFTWQSASKISIYVVKVAGFCFSYFIFKFIVTGHLHFSHMLGNVNNSAVNIGVQASFQNTDVAFFSYIPRSRIAGTYGNYFKFLKQPPQFSRDCVNYIPNINKVLLFSPKHTQSTSFFSKISSSTLVICLFDNSHFNVFEVILHGGFYLLSWWSVMLNIFLYTIGHLHVFFGKCPPHTF